MKNGVNTCIILKKHSFVIRDDQVYGDCGRSVNVGIIGPAVSTVVVNNQVINFLAVSTVDVSNGVMARVSGGDPACGIYGRSKQ